MIGGDGAGAAPAARVRPVRPSDLRRLAAIEDAGVVLFREYLGEAMVPALESPAPSGAERDGHGFLLVATVERALVGFAHVLDLDDDSRVAHLEQVSVLPAHGRRGIGAQLVRAAMEEARWAGYEEMSLCTYRDVPWNAPFYARLGFGEVSEPLAFQRRLRAHEQEIGLDAAGSRAVMSRRLAREP